MASALSGGSLEPQPLGVSFRRVGSRGQPPLRPVWQGGAETVSFSSVPPTFGKNIRWVKNEMGGRLSGLDG